MPFTKTIHALQFGTTGQLARELTKAASGLSEFSVRALSHSQADFQYPALVAKAALDSGPIDIVINATAYTAVDKAESEPGLARQINTNSVAALAKACHARNIPLIHVSTDYVFDGRKDEPYLERDTPNPLGVYGVTKLEGEDAIRTNLGLHAIIRTSWVYSAHGTNFVKTILRLGAQRDVLRIVDDQHGAPTSASNLANAILAIAKQIVTNRKSDLFGTFHYADRGETTWRRFAEAIFEIAGPAAQIRARVVPIASAEYSTPAARPSNSRLDCTKIESTYRIARKPWRESLVRVIDEIVAAQTGGVK